VSRPTIRRIGVDEGLSFEELEEIIGKKEYKASKKAKVKGTIDTYFEKLDKFIRKDWEL
jgi:hypothetical protein